MYGITVILNFLRIFFFQNGGLYIKLGQGLVSMNHILPKPYLEILKVSHWNLKDSLTLSNLSGTSVPGAFTGKNKFCSVR